MTTPTELPPEIVEAQSFDAVEAFDALLKSEKDQPEAEEPAADPEEEEAAPETEGEEPEATAEPEADPVAEEQPADPTYTVTIDGKQEAVPLSKLIAGYQMGTDYTKKTQAVAEDRRALREERSEYADLLPKLRASLEAGMGTEPDWEALYATNPTDAVVQRQRWADRQQKLQTVKAEEARVAKELEAERQAEIEQIVIQEHNKLLQKLPAWRDKAVAAKESAGIEAALRSYGLDGDELNLYDHRYLLMARDLMRFQQQQPRRAEIQAKAKAAPVVVPGKAKPVSKNEAFKRFEQLGRTGSVKDAAALFEKLI